MFYILLMNVPFPVKFLVNNEDLPGKKSNLFIIFWALLSDQTFVV